MHPATLLIWPAGLYYYLLSKGGKPYQALGWIYVILFAVFAVQNAKFYFLAPTYPILFAAGALMIERFIRWRQWNWLKPAYVSLLVISGIWSHLWRWCRCCPSTRSPRSPAPSRATPG
jgi:hypothetical protein